MLRKGRGPNRKGEKSPLAKVSNQDAKAIRSLIKQGEKSCVIARMYNVSPTCVYRIKYNKTFNE
jgi:DNA invertase Pin-like site-specific DNA recombinase